MGMRSDTFCTKLGIRECGMSRLWIEDSYARLTRNGFAAGTQFARRVQPGVGVVLEPNLLGSCAVSMRRGVPLLSLENSWLARQMPAADSEVRVRVSLGNIIVMPRLRLFHVGRMAADSAQIAGDRLTIGTEVFPLSTVRPQNHGYICEMIVSLDWQNLVLATECLGNSRPDKVSLTGDSLCVRLAGKFLSDGGYAEAEPGVFVAGRRR